MQLTTTVPIRIPNTFNTYESDGRLILIYWHIEGDADLDFVIDGVKSKIFRPRRRAVWRDEMHVFLPPGSHEMYMQASAYKGRVSEVELKAFTVIES